MKYTVNLRMRNPGPAKYLIESRDTDCMIKAFELAMAVLAETNNEHFVEIINNEDGTSVASFNQEKLGEHDV